jgi:hypothetical protein
MPKLKDWTPVKPVYDSLVKLEAEMKEAKTEVPPRFRKKVKDIKKLIEEHEIIGINV